MVNCIIYVTSLCFSTKSLSLYIITCCPKPNASTNRLNPCNSSSRPRRRISASH